MKERWYIFTFGCGQKHEGYYVLVHGTYESAREKMIEKHGIDWAFQYSIEEWEEWVKNRPYYVPVEKELEVIE